MKVALLSHEGGGISSVAHGLAAALAKKNVEATIFTTTTSDVQSSTENPSHYNVVSLPMVDLPPRSIWFHLRNSKALSRMLGDYDVVHAVSPEMAIPYVLFGKLRKPLVTTLHGSHRAALSAFLSSPIKSWTLGDLTFNLLELPLHEATTKWCFDGSAKVTVCSCSTLDEIRKFENVDVSKATVIYNGIDLADINRKSEANDGKEDSDDRPTILYAGRLFWMKGINYVLEAFKRIREGFEVRLRIFGKGPMQKEVENFIKQNGLQESAFFGGFLPHKELIGEIKQADAVIFPSLYESQPMFVLEAMACKKPVIAFDLPYAREITLNGKNGLLAKACDLEDLCNKTNSVLYDENLRMSLGQNGYDHVMKNHDWLVQAGKYFEVYEALIAEGKY